MGQEQERRVPQQCPPLLAGQSPANPHVLGNALKCRCQVVRARRHCHVHALFPVSGRLASVAQAGEGAAVCAGTPRQPTCRCAPQPYHTESTVKGRVKRQEASVSWTKAPGSSMSARPHVFWVHVASSFHCCSSCSRRPDVGSVSGGGLSGAAREKGSREKPPPQPRRELAPKQASPC